MDSILDEVRLSYGGDPFGSVQEWRFSIAQWLTDNGEFVPDFRGASDLREEYAYEVLTDIGPSIPQAQYALKILDRAREIIGAMGMDY